jgi:hypothetical protein
MTDINNPSETVPDVNDVVTPVGNENVSQSDALTLEEINQTLGRNYADKPTALKALKETFSFVGKKADDIAPAITAAPTTSTDDATAKALADIQKQLKTSQFYENNPEYNTPEAKELINSFGGEPEEVIQKDIFKKALKAIQSESVTDKSQSVMRSNSRVAATDSDYQTDFEAAQASGNWAGFLAKHKGIELQE